MFTSSVSSILVAVVNVNRIVRPSVTYRRSDLVLVSNVPHEETRALVLHCLMLGIDDPQDCHCFCTI